MSAKAAKNGGAGALGGNLVIEYGGCSRPRKNQPCHTSSPSYASVHLPTAIPGGAEQTEGEGGVSQLLQQLWRERGCVCRMSPLYTHGFLRRSLTPQPLAKLCDFEQWLRCPASKTTNLSALSDRQLYRVDQRAWEASKVPLAFRLPTSSGSVCSGTQGFSKPI